MIECCCSLSACCGQQRGVTNPAETWLAAMTRVLLHIGRTHCRQLTASQEQTMQECVLPASLLVQLAL